MRPLTSRRQAVLATLLSACATPVLAQFGNPGGMGSGRRSRSADMGTDTGRRREPREEVQAPTVRQNQFNERLANLRLQLLITAAQVTPWDDFAASASAWAAEAFRRHDPAPSATAQQMLQARLTEAQNRFTLLESLVDSTKRLYQVLTPEQQRVADYYLPTVIP